MLKNWKKKLIAMLLIFTMTFSNFALVGKTYAAYLMEGIFGNKVDTGDTGSANVEFDAYFKTNQNNKTAKIVTSDIKNTDLMVGATVKVKDSGYLKDAKILFGNGKELNFKINNEIQIPIPTEETTIQEVQGETLEPNQEEILGEYLGIEETVETIEEIEEPKIEQGEILGEMISVETEEQEPTVETEEQELIVETEPQDLIEEEVLEEISVEYETIDLVEENEKVQTFEDNQLYLTQLDAGSEMKIEFPISYEYKRFVEKSMISKSNQIKFEGTYVNDNAEEIAVSKTIDLKLSWEDEREITTSSEITKYIGFHQDGVDGIILQNSILVDSSTNHISLPIKDSRVEVSVPEIEGMKPDSVNVVAKSLKGTTGKENEEMVFGEENWNYDSENNQVTITVSNQPELVSTQNEKDILIDETAPMREMYYSESGSDQYLITYIYKNVTIGERDIQTAIHVTFNEFGETTLVSENEQTISLKDEIGDIVTYSNETTNSAISKGYAYLNYNIENDKYEIDIDNAITFNVSYKDIVDGLYYVDNGSEYIDKSGLSYSHEDLYYKVLKMNKDNFLKMLGEDGFVNVYNHNDFIFVINKDTLASEEGIIEINFDHSVKNLQIETSKPISDGNLMFNITRSYSNVSYEKNEYKNFDKLTINTEGKAKYIYLEELATVGNSNLEVKLTDTKTEATLEIGQENLSTLAMNNHVELKIELNNENVQSDIYGNSRFQIKLPEYIETVSVTDYSIVYGEGLELDQVQCFEQDGQKYIDITVKGKQTALSSGIISHGTNIVLYADLKVDLFAPATEGVFELVYMNEEVTNYPDGNLEYGMTTAKISYSAPSGVVSVNSISGYAPDGNRTITSVNQGKMQDEIAIYAESRVAKVELTVMNNTRNNISDMMILGRFPFAGVKDIINGDDLGTTLTPRILSRIVPVDMNETDFQYYYSENENATNDLLDSENGWTMEPTTLDNVKSFLIVPTISEYQMEALTKLRFTYEYEIPANLEHNEEIYGTFVTYYTNLTEVALINEVSKADLVGLVTGEGPKFDFTTVVNKERVSEYEELEVTTIVKNSGKVMAKDIVVTIPIPKFTSYISSSSNQGNIIGEYRNGKVVFQLDSFDVGSTIQFKTIVSVEAIKDSDENIELPFYSQLTAKDLGTELKTEEKLLVVEKAELKVYISKHVDIEEIMYKGYDFKLYIRVQNLKKETIHNAVVTMNIPEGIEVIKAVRTEFVDEIDVEEVGEGKFDPSTRMVTWNIDEIGSMETSHLEIQLDIKELDDNITKRNIVMSVNAKADETQEYTFGSMEYTIGKPLLVITQTSTKTNAYVKEGDMIDYQFVVKNEGTVMAQEVVLTDIIPKGLIARTVSYKSEGIEVTRNVSSSDKIVVDTDIPAGDSLVVNITAYATDLNGKGELSITNSGTVEGANIAQLKSNEITHIIEATENQKSTMGERSTGKASSSNETTLSISKTYKITGTAWLDKDNDGMRNDSEPLMKGITATLVDSDNGVIKQSTVTNSKGEYTFTKVRNGNYIIIFDYDTTRYTVTVYQKENIAQNVNSDAITTKIEQDGKIRNGAVTRVVTVENGSVSNIDIGLIDALKFDLRLDMGISKVTTNTGKGTDTKTYENSKLTKTEFGAKQVAGSSVYIEYTLTVKNEGEVAGYAKKIADYLPEGMEFNSGMNSSWYTGSDGNLYTNSLANIELQPGETKTLKLVLSKQLNDNNLGTVSNTAEIVEDYNIYGISDLDSTPANKAQNEDDFARADSYLSVRTGEIFIYISVIVTTIILVGTMVTVMTLKLKSRKKLIKGGAR